MPDLTGPGIERITSRANSNIFNDFYFVLEELFQTLLDLSRLSEESLISSPDEGQFKTSLPGIGPLQETGKSN